MTLPSNPYIVISVTGEHGPMDLRQMHRGLLDGTFAATDRVRTTAGQDQGTVESLVGSRIRTPTHGIQTGRVGTEPIAGLEAPVGARRGGTEPIPGLDAPAPAQVRRGGTAPIPGVDAPPAKTATQPLDPPAPPVVPVVPVVRTAPAPTTPAAGTGPGTTPSRGVVVVVPKKAGQTPAQGVAAGVKRATGPLPTPSPSAGVKRATGPLPVPSPSAGVKSATQPLTPAAPAAGLPRSGSGPLSPASGVTAGVPAGAKSSDRMRPSSAGNKSGRKGRTPAYGSRRGRKAWKPPTWLMVLVAVVVGVVALGAVAKLAFLDLGNRQPPQTEQQ